MKYSFVLLAGVLLSSACTVETTEVGQAAPSMTQGIVGIDFASMPVGTQAHYRNSDGDTWVEVYRGQRGRFHAMERISDSQVAATQLYLADGTLHRREYADGNVRTFSPRRCMRVVGDCQFRSSDTKPRRSSQNQGQMARTGDTYRYTFGPTDGSSQRTFEYKLGRFNLLTSATSGNYSERLVRLVTP